MNVGNWASKKCFFARVRRVLDLLVVSCVVFDMSIDCKGLEDLLFLIHFINRLCIVDFLLEKLPSI